MKNSVGRYLSVSLTVAIGLAIVSFQNCGSNKDATSNSRAAASTTKPTGVDNFVSSCSGAADMPEASGEVTGEKAGCAIKFQHGSYGKDPFSVGGILFGDNLGKTNTNIIKNFGSLVGEPLLTESDCVNLINWQLEKICEFGLDIDYIRVQYRRANPAASTVSTLIDRHYSKDMSCNRRIAFPLKNESFQ